MNMVCIPAYIAAFNLFSRCTFCRSAPGHRVRRYQRRPVGVRGGERHPLVPGHRASTAEDSLEAGGRTADHATEERERYCDR